jgi:hypothetical protein
VATAEAVPPHGGGTQKGSGAAIGFYTTQAARYCFKPNFSGLANWVLISFKKKIG